MLRSVPIRSERTGICFDKSARVGGFLGLIVSLVWLPLLVVRKGLPLDTILFTQQSDGNIKQKVECS